MGAKLPSSHPIHYASSDTENLLNFLFIAAANLIYSHYFKFARLVSITIDSPLLTSSSVDYTASHLSIVLLADNSYAPLATIDYGASESIVVDATQIRYKFTLTLKCDRCFACGDLVDLGFGGVD